MSLPVEQVILEYIGYDPETGDLWWKKKPSHAVNEGDKITCLNLGYIKLQIKGKQLWGHRVAWLLHHGEWPDCIDHINGNRADNRICNLRSVSYSQNNMNRPSWRKKKSSKWKGVQPCRGKWAATIQKDGVIYRLGYFDDEREAAEAYIFAALELHGDYARVE